MTRKLPADSYFDEKAADKVVWFFERLLVHVKGDLRGKPFKLAQWQKDLLRELFGRKRADGKRLYRHFYLEIPRKAGKSLIAAGLALYMLCADGEGGAEVYSAAGSEEQARTVFKMAQQMARQSPLLSKTLKIEQYGIQHPDSDSVYRSVSAKAENLHGGNSHFVVIDELHIAPNRNLYDVLKTSVGSRSQPLIAVITTAGHDKSSVCYELHEYTQGVNSGDIDDPTWLGKIFGSDVNDDWTDPKIWKQVNPNLGITPHLEYLQAECEKAKLSAGAAVAFRQLHCGQWVDNVEGWLNTTCWKNNVTDWRPEEGDACTLGIDLATKDDLTALVLCFKHPEGGHYFEPYFFCPEMSLENRGKSKKMSYKVWANNGDILLTPGELTDYDFVYNKLQELNAKYNIIEAAFDPYNATQLMKQAADLGLRVVELPPTNTKRLANSLQDFENQVVSGDIKHPGHPILTWMAGNAIAEQDPYGNLKIRKGKATEKIDGIVAAVMAFDRARINESFMTNGDNGASVDDILKLF